jgi:hypothetical protein
MAFDYYEDPGFPSDRDGVCVVCDRPYARRDLIAQATPEYWRPKPSGGTIRMAHVACANRSRRERDGVTTS